MVNRALCFGLTYPTGEGGSPIPGCDVDARNMGALARTMGIADVSVVTDSAAPVTRDQILDGLRDMVAQAQPGDTLLFSYAGHGSQREDSSGKEADGLNEVLCAADGVVTDDEIRGILAGLPEGAQLVISVDSCSNGSIADLDVGGDEIAGTVVCISASQDDQYSLGGTNGGAFTNALVSVLGANPGISWIDAVQRIDEADQYDTQRPVLTSNRTETLMRPAFTLERSEAPAAAEVMLDEDHEEANDDPAGDAETAATDDLAMDIASLDVTTDSDLLNAGTADSEVFV
ncbi:B-1 B cell differentiation [Blastocladiella emersonii ATCC 22665]|nr:B-1 B cell differentiation [Blastocladiella emersonii ATCC 22665]